MMTCNLLGRVPCADRNVCRPGPSLRRSTEIDDATLPGSHGLGDREGGPGKQWTGKGRLSGPMDSRMHPSRDVPCSSHLGRRARSVGGDRLFCAVYRLRNGWLLKHKWSEDRGAAPVEMTFAIILLMTLTLGVIQVAFTLYARNVVAASAHEAARAALERGRSESEAASIAREVVTRATGRLVDDLTVNVATRGPANRRFVSVRVRGVVTDFGPVPLPIHLSSTATAQIDEVRRK
jgi:hypothetical protein